jgi:hypothetical protein
MTTDKTPTGLALLRLPFPPNQISKLPKPTPKQTDAVKANMALGIRCKECGQWHHKDAVHLDYVGHAALTDRLLDCDPLWNWEPLAIGPVGAPVLDGDGGMWIKLTVCGVTRLGYGHADGKKGGNATKEVIGDALRNAAMRFGAALDLWHKGDLHGDDEEVITPARQAPAKAAPEPLEDIITFTAKIDATVFAISKQQSVEAMTAYWHTLEKAVQADAKVIAAAKKRKAELMTDDAIPYEGAA